VKWAITTYELANWHPLTWLSHALGCELFGLNPAGRHYMNVLLHAVNVMLLFLLRQSANRFRSRSLMVAALYCAAPDQRRVSGLDGRAERRGQSR
jgi:protein O-mannosyl-transferase